MTQYFVNIKLDTRETEAFERALSHYLDASRCDTTIDWHPHMSVVHLSIKLIRRKLKVGRKRPGGPSFDDGQQLTIERALKDYLHECNQAIANGIAEPFIIDRVAIERISTRMSNEFWRAVADQNASLVAQRQPPKR